MKDWYNTLIFGAALILIWTLFRQSDGVSPSHQPIEQQTVIPQPKIYPYHGQAFEWQQIKDYDVSIIKFYASWCGFCRRELPVLKTLKNMNVAPMFGIAVGDSEKKLDKLFTRYENPYDYNAIDKNKSAMRAFGVRGLPSTVIVDKNMKVRFVYTGAMSENDIRRKILPIINKVKKELNASTEETKEKDTAK